MKKYSLFLFMILVSFGCTYFGKLKLVSVLPGGLKEVSGVEYPMKSNILWMHNDSGNKSEVFAMDVFGKKLGKIKLKQKNRDWEDITSDSEGNLYIADFGNNDNKRKNLVIYKIGQEKLTMDGKIDAEEITFSYPDQEMFPPKKKDRFFDAESIFYNNGYLYIFSKSRVKNKYGETTLYKVRATPGEHMAILMGRFNTCDDDLSCWITAADISPDRNKVALLNHNTVFIFSDFEGDNFFEGKLVKYNLGHTSQKEGLTFKDNNTLYIVDEKSHGTGGNLYEFSLN
ncbi:hypothetical protein SAMN04489761_4532 [Tenacibaculum sp. MAR_2009_124]|uniref:hypothetical protein n=1 Tax=Tenacibaculum sp. MAR_2009_124 TaxID=1250059 RepID=UPI0008957877|nr:hypothetical protein [Tenacibaculum sp. MAR_2009_124]SED17985.1 hypothetical protein SAMN04489761_4532 [Tenacibaculum sp. MAR_2009_124]